MSKSAVASLLRAFSGAMARLHLDWYVFGAQAVVVHGRPRLTADVDITVDLGTHAVEELTDVLKKAGFLLRTPVVPGFLQRTRVLPVVHSRTEMPVDVVLAGPGLEREFLGRAKRLDLGGFAAPVISPEDLLVTKILAGRPKDLDDVRGVIEEQGTSLDLRRVREVLAALEAALGQSDLSPMLDRVLAEARPRKRGIRKTPARRAPRRR